MVLPFFRQNPFMSKASMCERTRIHNSCCFIVYVDLTIFVSLRQIWSKLPQTQTCDFIPSEDFNREQLWQSYKMHKSREADHAEHHDTYIWIITFVSGDELCKR